MPISTKIAQTPAGGRMSENGQTKQALMRVIGVFEKRPEKARSTNHATACVRDGLQCNFTQGDKKAVMDMPPIMGGDDTGPTPGFFARAGIAGCVSIGIKQAAILADLEFDQVTVDIETDFDDAAMFGIGTGSAAPLETRLSIHVETTETEAEVTRLIDEVLERDPWFLALREAQTVKLKTTVLGED
jgi:uncharacterized OsmC-like protein